jgi:ATP-binding cassette subfamily B (MDR/TAP) protein 1
VLQVIYSIRTVTAFGGQVKELARYCSKLSNARAAGVRSGFLLACSLGLVYMFFYWGYAIAFWFGGKLISEDVKNSFTNKVWTGGDVVIVFFSGLNPSSAAARSCPAALSLTSLQSSWVCSESAKCSLRWTPFALAAHPPDAFTPS